MIELPGTTTSPGSRLRLTTKPSNGVGIFVSRKLARCYSRVFSAATISFGPSATRRLRPDECLDSVFTFLRFDLDRGSSLFVGRQPNDPGGSRFRIG